MSIQTNSEFLVFDPWSVERNQCGKFYTWRQVHAFLMKAHREIYDRLKAEGREIGLHRFSLMAVNREKPDLHRWFNLGFSNREHGLTFALRDHGGGSYEGGLSFLESLFDGRWRIATLQEEAECKAKDEAETREAKRQEALKGTAFGGTAALLESLGLNKSPQPAA